MSAIANILFYIAIFSFIAGVLLNLNYLLKLPFTIPTRARWPVFVWIVMLAGLGQWFGRQASISGAASVDTSAIIQIASIGVVGMTMLLVASKSFKLSNFKLPFLMLFMYAFLGVLTSPISDVPLLSVFKATSMLVAVLLAVMALKPLITETSPRLIFNVVYIYFIFISFLAVLGGVFAPDVTHKENEGVFGYMLEGWPPLNSNSLSYVAAVTFVVSIRRFFIKDGLRRRILYAGLALVGAVTLLMAQGRTSIISSVIAVLFMSYYIKDMRSLRFVMLFGLVGVVVLFSLSGTMGDWVGSVQQYMQRGVTDEQIGTLSGRTVGWELSWKLFLESPIIGYGFYAAGKTLLAPHNAYFTVLLNGGLLGFVPWFFGVVGGVWLISRRVFYVNWKYNSPENNFYKEILAVLIIQIARTITGQDLTIHSYSMLMFLSMVIYMIVLDGMHIKNGKEVNNSNSVTKLVITESKYSSVILKKR